MAKQKKLIDEHNYKIVLQQLAENEYLDSDISDFDFKSFSNEKNMFDYQTEALKNAFRVLLKFYKEYDANKEEFYNKEYKKYSHVNLDYQKPNDLLKEHFKVLDTRIEFYNFINRMSFWMTMGSGKTIVIIKLVELLDKAMELGLIPKKNILFFTANEGLLDRFKKEIDEYNRLNTNKAKNIDTLNLKDYEKERKSFSLFDEQYIKLFCYRADLLSNERKETILDFNDYLDDGNNYIILDEAHKGDKQDSKRQNIFSILAKNGFLFNFSATFTDDSDIATTVYNLNQAVWVKKGYGKKLFLLDNDLKAFKDKSDLNELEKKKATLKSLILLAFEKQNKIKDFYHDPMMVVFTNSVNTVEADAEIFFRTLESIAKDDVADVFSDAKKELYDEFKDTKYLVTDKDGEGVSELAQQIKEISLRQLKELIFYSQSGNIEAIVNPKDKTEIAFKLDSSDKPFCLIKIGDISSWLKEKLKNIKIDETFKEESYFKTLDNSSINILLGSRAFYEGWDTTRPNIMLFLNIGMDKDAKKFVTQSIGRGMRVESVPGNRQRLDFIDIDKKTKLTQNSKALETLFIISTNKDAISSIISWQEDQNKGIDWHEIELEKNDMANDKILYIPAYKLKKVKIGSIDNKNAFKLSSKNKKDLQEYIKNMSKHLFALKHKLFNKEKCDLFFNMVKSDNSFYTDENSNYKSLDILIEKLKNRLYVNQSDIDSFKNLNDEIIHFKKIKVREDKKDDFSKMISKTINLKYLSEDEIKEKIINNEINIDEIQEYRKTFIEFDYVKFKKILNHYYNPIISGNKIDWIRNIISEESEIIFLDELGKISEQIDNKYDWWMFSKINQYYDKVFIPYTENAEEKLFYPDFIFWLQKDNKQTILFVDPKGTKHTSYEHKVDGYKNIFLDVNDKKVKRFNLSKISIDVRLALIKTSNDSISDGYKNYWYGKDNLLDMF